MSKLDARELQRLRYWQGQMLRSRDFRDQLAIDAQLRWWHNRALHNSFGVSFGLEVSLESKKNGSLTAAHVSCGLAYDCFGQELILQKTREIPLPSVSQNEEKSTLTLLIQYKETYRYPKRHGVEAEWPGTGALFDEEPELMWKPSARVQLGDGVPLVRMDYGGATPSLDKEFVVPRSRPLARPNIASGATMEGATAWEIWSPTFGGRPLPLGLQVKIDTSAAGFTDDPCYFASLQGFSSDQSQAALGLLLFFEHLNDTSSSGFTFRVLSFNPELFADLKQQLFVCWVGIQPNADFVDDFNKNEVNHGNA